MLDDGTFPRPAHLEVDPATIEDNPAARQAIETIRNDLFNFSADSVLVPLSESPEEREAVANLSFRACALIEHYVGKPGHRKQRKIWEKEGTATLPDAKIGDKLFRLGARRNLETGITHIEFGRAEEGVPPNGFTIVRDVDGNSSFLLTIGRDGVPELDKDQQLNAIEQATRWIDGYSRAIGINRLRLNAMPYKRTVPETIPRMLDQRRRKIRIGVIAGAFSLAAAGGLGTIANAIYGWHQSNNAEWDASHFLPDSALPVAVGHSGPVGYGGGSIDQEIIDHVETNNGESRHYEIEDAGPHYIRTNQEIQLAPSGKGNSYEASCESITIDGLSGQATVKVAAIHGGLAQNMIVQVERTGILLCNTDKENDLDIQPRELFIEITDPEE